MNDSNNELINYLCSVLKVELGLRNVKFWNPIHDDERTLMSVEFHSQTVLITMEPFNKNQEVEVKPTHVNRLSKY